MGTTDPFAKGMPRRHGSRRYTSVAPPCGAARAAARCKTRLRPALLDGEDPDPRSSPEAAPSRAVSISLLRFAVPGYAWDRAGRPLRATPLRTPNPPFFQSFLTLRVYQTTLPCQPAPDTQNPAEADVSAGIQPTVCPRGRTPPTTGEGSPPSHGRRLHRVVWNQCLSATLCVWGAASRCNSSGELLQF